MLCGDNELESKESDGRVIFGSLSADYGSPINPDSKRRSSQDWVICDP
jgi:hypothetical protein